MARLSRRGFFAAAVVFHLIYIYSIFDIYFVSPIVHGMREHEVGVPSPAKRLFLVVGDGLRADKCFQQHADPDEPSQVRYLAPFIRSKVLEEGTFGVSHTRVPTESRPGHVALIAGLYEDVSAVTTGWKLNPVNFDSVFNQSRHTWSWGSPDILPMFKEGASDHSRIDAWTYDEEMEDFTQDAVNLDIWVFDRVKDFFEDARRNSTLTELLHKDKLVFFLHLLGLDTTGHSYRPYSREYLRNIKVVDDGLRRINALVDDFYGHDGKTAWVFTADHGMSDWGSHGDGHPDNTRTPLVAWGAGVKKPITISKRANGKAAGHDGFSSDWGLDSIRRVDVNQADVAALMAYLVGVNFPVNSVGELPLEYLNADPETLAKAAWTNARQILEMYRVKEEQKRARLLRFKPFSLLKDLDRKFGEIETLLGMGAHHLAVVRSTNLIKIGLEGLRYLQTYDWLFLRTLITLGYVGWITFALTTVMDLHVLNGKAEARRTTFSYIFFGGTLASVYILFIIQRARLTYYSYAFFPILFWEEVFVRRAAIVRGIRQLVSEVKGGQAKYIKIVLQPLGALAFLEAIVTGYFHRESFTICYLLATAWPLMQGTKFVRRNKHLALGWIVSCVVMSTFTLLSAVKVESEAQILLGGALMFALGLLYLHSADSLTGPLRRSQIEKTIQGIQVGFIGLAMIVTSSSVRSLQAKAGLPLGNQVVGWLTLISSLLVPLAHSFTTPRLETDRDPLHALASLFLTFSPTFTLLSISYEALFFVSFTLLLAFWTQLERQIHSRDGALLTPQDLRTSLFFFFLLQSAFFSTGNIASISSFSLDSVYRLIPIFSPFAMGALLLYKIFIPFVMVATALGGLRRAQVWMVATAVSDVLTLNFFWLVKDEGSWLEIGSTISHFCIGGALGVFVSVLEGVAGVTVGRKVAGGVRAGDERNGVEKKGGGIEVNGEEKRGAPKKGGGLKGSTRRKKQN